MAIFPSVVNPEPVKMKTLARVAGHLRVSDSGNDHVFIALFIVNDTIPNNAGIHGMETNQIYDFHDGLNHVDLAVKTAAASNGAGPGIVWLGGYRSDMTGTKAQALVAHAASLGVASLRFDYSGHGASDGKFEDGTISDWVKQSLAVLRTFSKGPQTLVGSSMGGWIALRLVQELQKLKETGRLAGLILIAPAPDFTLELAEPRFSEEQKEEMVTNGFVLEPSAYSDEPNVITRTFIEDGRQNLVLNSDLHVGVPVRILQGMKDLDVPYTHALKLVHALPHDDVVITMIKDGDHRLSRPQDIELLLQVTEDLVANQR